VARDLEALVDVVWVSGTRMNLSCIVLVVVIYTVGMRR